MTFPSPYYILDSPKSKTWIGYQSIKRDLQFVLLQLNNIEYYEVHDISKPDREITIKALWISSFVIYAKCFASSNKGRGTRLHKEKVFSESSEDLKLHIEIINLRNNHIAHAGSTNFEKIEPRISLEMRGDSFYPHLIYKGVSMAGFNLSVLVKFRKLIESIILYVEDIALALSTKILQEEAEKYTREEFLQKMREQYEADNSHESQYNR